MGLGDTGLDRRTLLAWLPIGAAAVGGAAASAASAEAFTGVDASTRLWLRLMADPAGRPVLAVQRGVVWGFLPQADDLQTADFARRLYGYAGLTVRRLTRPADGSAILWSCGWHIYTDATTGEAIDRLSNPYTGALVDPPAFTASPTTVRYGAAPGSGQTAGAPVVLERRRLGDRAMLELVRLSRFKTPDIDWFKLEADMTTYVCRDRDLDDPRGGFLNPTWSHNLVAEWQTWMHMHGAPGHILFRGEGGYVSGADAVPAGLRRAVERMSPGVLAQVVAQAD